MKHHVLYQTTLAMLAIVQLSQPAFADTIAQSTTQTTTPSKVEANTETITETTVKKTTKTTPATVKKHYRVWHQAQDRPTFKTGGYYEAWNAAEGTSALGPTKNYTNKEITTTSTTTTTQK